MKKICLIGNPNCGKTTIFNKLTGTYQKVGNWSGVTVEKKQGLYIHDKDVEITDLPGLYSLTPRSDDERAVLNYLSQEKPDCIINVIDGTNLERNLYLTCSLYKLGIPVIIAVNFIDDLRKNGIKVNVNNIEKVFNVPIITVSGLKNENLDKMIKLAISNKKIISRPNLTPYEFIEKNVNDFISSKITKSQRITEKLDNIILNKYLAIPIFVLVIFIVYFLSIKLGGILSEKIKTFFDIFSINTKNSLTKLNAKPWVISLLIDAVLKGFSTVISFLPQVLILFLLLTIIEESGYASRIAFITDKILSNVGLSGKSFIPMMLCSGCTVTGLMATKTVESTAEKRTAIILLPFIPCGAKTAVFGWLSGVMFNGNVLIATSTYFLGLACIVVFGKILKKYKFISHDDGLFVMEMPTYRLPVIKNVAYVLWEKVKDFTFKTGTIIFAVSVMLWFLSNFGFSGFITTDKTQSFMYYLGNGIKFIFYPLGFASVETSIAILSSFMAKEAVIETLGYLSSNVPSLFNNGFTAYAFMTFVLLSPPCVASVLTAHKLLNSKKYTIFMLLFQFITAYVVSFIINLLGIIINLVGNLQFFIIFVIIITLAIKITAKTFKSCGNGCVNCKGKNICRKKSKHSTTI